MRAVKRLTAKRRKDDADQQEKYKYDFYDIGVLFKREDGSLVVKLDTIPTFTGWNGWVDVTDIPEKKSKVVG